MSVPPVGNCPGTGMTITPFTTSVNVPESFASECFASARARFDIAALCTASGSNSVSPMLNIDGLTAEEQRRRALAAAVEREVVGEMVAADLQHPRLTFGGCAEDAEEIVGAVPADLAFVDRLQEVIGDADFVEHRESAGRKRRGRDAACRVSFFSSRSPRRRPSRGTMPTGRFDQRIADSRTKGRSSDAR